MRDLTVVEMATAPEITATAPTPARFGDHPVHPLAEQLSLAFLRQHAVLPLVGTDGGILLACSDPADRFAIDAVAVALGGSVCPLVAPRDEIEAAIERFAARRSGQILPAVESANREPDASEASATDLRDLALDAPVVQIVNQILQEATFARATDIHLEPFENRFAVRIRVDGVLRPFPAPPRHLARAIVSRIKILSGLDIAERRLPQDGRARLRIAGRTLDLRVATTPTLHGEAAAIRILQNVRRELDLDRLGFRASERERLIAQLRSPHGMIVVTGPTGSGKTTTLATLLAVLNDGDRKILTIEDPIEYELDGINQTQVRPGIGLTFASALRSFLRHDPDVIMVGEMRDGETAHVGVQAALTGHLVLTTLHTNSAAGALVRLIDMGVDGFMLASALRCVVGQRLVRLLCPSCKTQRSDTRAALAGLSLREDDRTRAERAPMWRAVGCDRCHGTGYADRTVITEILTVDDRIRALLAGRPSAAEIQAAAMASGMTAMLSDGLHKCLDGATSLEELTRAVTEA